MNKWSVEEFCDFFEAIHPGQSPFLWQKRLAEYVMSTGQWPSTIDAPTGAGKTAVIDVHLFCVAAMAAGGMKVPRRLSVVVDRRSIVDSHADYAHEIRQALQNRLNKSEVCRRMDEALRSLRVQEQQEGASPFRIAVLRGGAAPSRAWLDDPTECQILLSTPDMCGGRLLFRPFGATSLSAPRSAGLLAYDSVIVIDEAHLVQQFTHLSRSVSTAASRHAHHLGVPPLQVVSMTATQPSDAEDVIGVQADDMEPDHDPVLRERMTKHKPVKIVELATWPPLITSPKATATVIVREAVELYEKFGGTVACVVNTIRMAHEVHSQLTAAQAHRHPTVKYPDGAGAVETLVGRMREDDVLRIRQEYPQLFTTNFEEQPAVSFLVATQTIEVGLDADFSSMVTELASAQALAQRVGRVNRIGQRDACEVVVIGPTEADSPDRSSGIYNSEDLRAAMLWLKCISENPQGITPAAVMTNRPPAAKNRRPAFLRVEPWDAAHWSQTSVPLFCDPDLELWLDDDFSLDLDVTVVVRRGLDKDDPAIAQWLAATPPQRHEGMSVNIAKVRQFLDDPSFLGDQQISNGERIHHFLRAGEVKTLESAAEIRPGDTLFVSDRCQAFVHGVFTPEGGGQAIDDVYESTRVRTRDGELSYRGRRVRIDEAFAQATDNKLLERLRQAAIDVGPDETEQNAIIEVLRNFVSQAKGTSHKSSQHSDAIDLLHAILHKSPAANQLVITPTAADEVWEWVVIADTSRLSEDEEIRQTYSPKSRVLLDDHSTAVATRSHQIAQLLELPQVKQEEVRQAGRWHDQGKSDPRFQFALRNAVPQESDEPLAKSSMRSPLRIQQAWAASGLGRWRHEQLSAALYYAQISASQSGDDAIDVNLVTRLVGTSHGRGRATFDDNADGLLVNSRTDEPVAKAARALYAHGEWEKLIESTDQNYGYWGCAYLEALVRAADGQVSGEGR